jgi:type III pantothenate kinase
MNGSGKDPRALLVDVGNSRIKWRSTAGGGDGASPVNSLDDGVPSAWHDLAPPERVLVSKVGSGPRREGIEQWCVNQWGVTPRFVDSTTNVPGIRNGYADPAQLGVDRWLAIIAARRLDPVTTVVVDCGTAITMDLLDRDGLFRGGMILPGRRLLESVFPSRIPYLDASSPSEVPFPATNTGDAIALGIHTAIVASLDRFIENSGLLTQDQPRVRITGGDGPWLRDMSQRDVIVHENLVLDGLYILMESDV